MQSAVIIALLVVMAVHLCYWGRAKRQRRRHLKQRVVWLHQWLSRLRQTMRQAPADGLTRCQTENDLLIKAFRSTATSRPNEHSGWRKKAVRPGSTQNSRPLARSEALNWIWSEPIAC